MSNNKKNESSSKGNTSKAQDHFIVANRHQLCDCPTCVHGRAEDIGNGLKQTATAGTQRPMASIPQDASRYPDLWSIRPENGADEKKKTHKLDPEDPNLARSTLYTTEEAALRVAPASAQSDLMRDSNSAKTAFGEMQTIKKSPDNMQVSPDAAMKYNNIPKEPERVYSTPGGSRRTQPDNASKAVLEEMKAIKKSPDNMQISPDAAGKVNNSPRDLDRKYDTQGGSRIGANAGHMPAAVPSRAEILAQDRGTGNPQSKGNADATRGSKGYSPSTPKRTSTRALEESFQENHGSVYPQAVHAKVQQHAQRQQQDRKARGIVSWLRMMAGRARL